MIADASAEDGASSRARRVDVIDSLRAGQAGPVNLLAMLGETVNGTEAVWLSKMDDTGPAVKLVGTALSTDAVANLIANLQKTGLAEIEWDMPDLPARVNIKNLCRVNSIAYGG